ncbi:reverse transcriptase domain-containing protein [Tanacetum coccineum]
MNQRPSFSCFYWLLRALYFFLGFLTSARAWLGLRFKVEKSCKDEMRVCSGDQGRTRMRCKGVEGFSLQRVTRGSFLGELRPINGNRKEWADKLDDALWTFKTVYKTPIGNIPFRIVYEKACHLPVEIEHKAYWALDNANLNLRRSHYSGAAS